MNKFKITEQERRDIRSQYGIVEQTPNKELSIIRFSAEESKKIYQLFVTEFIPTVIPDFLSLTPPQFIGKLNSLTEEQLSGAMGFFTQKGYKQPNPQIKVYQEELMRMTNYKSFTPSTQKTTAFNDGVFGIATAKASIVVRTSSLERMTDQTKTMGELGKKTEDLRKSGTNVVGDLTPEPPKTGKDIKLSTGTQPIG